MGPIGMIVRDAPRRGHRSWRRRVALVAAVALLGAIELIGGAAPASATPPTWKRVLSPGGVLPGGLAPLAVSCTSISSCVAVGDEPHGSDYGYGYGDTFAMAWDGWRWTLKSSLLSTSAGRLYDVSCGSPTFCAAVGTDWPGEPAATVWNGTTWSHTASVEAPVGGGALAHVSCLSATSCVAIGTAGSATLVETWDGSSWTITPGANPQAGAVLSDLACQSATDCVAVGSYPNAGVNRTLVEAWSGSGWTVVASPNQGASPNALAGVSCTSAASCVAVGAYSNGVNNRTLVERWNGSLWTISSSPSPGTVDQLSGVSCTSTTSCVAVGASVDSFAVSSTLIEEWDGTTWTVNSTLPSGGKQSLTGVACLTDGSCMAVGSYPGYADNWPYIGTPPIVPHTLTQLRMPPGVTAPGAPTAVSGIAGDGTATVSWTPPTSDGGLPIREYEVRGFQAGVPAFGAVVAAPSTSVVASSLTNGAGYTFTVMARNLAGDSPFSSASASIVPVRTTLMLAGEAHACVILPATGALKCWGRGTSGQLGDGTTFNRTTPVAVPSLTNVKFLALGAAHTCALLADTTVKCWGSNAYGQLGDGTTTPRLAPVTVSGLSGVKSIDAEGQSTCAILTTNTMKCWGRNTSGQLGDGTLVNRLTPVAVAGLTGVVMSTGSATHRCAALTGFAVKCWGLNNWGQLGDGTLVNRLTPTAVPALAGTGRWVSAHGNFTCALVTGNTVKCWGQNTYGQLGDGTTIPRKTPVSVVGLINVTNVNGGTFHSCARLSNTTAKCWGLNSSGQLGDGTLVNRLTPVSVLGPTKIVSIQPGDAFTAIRVTTGGIRTWGANTYGQLGNGTITQRSTPGFVTGLT